MPRGCLPLAALQPGSDPDRDEGLYPQFFTADIDSLKGPFIGKSQNDKTLVLIAEATRHGNGLYAVERVDDGLYAFVKLAKTVELNDLRQFERYSSPSSDAARTNGCQRTAPNGGEWWLSMRISRPDIKRRKLEDNIRSRVRLQANTETRESEDEDGPNAPLEEPHDEHRDRSDLQSPNEVNEPRVEDEFQNLDEILATFKAQYREALYVSKTSLAYFAKGPLARVRAFSTKSENTALSSDLLIERLTANLLPLTTVDKKFRETIPEIVKDLPAMLQDNDDYESYLVTLRKKVRKSRKDKVGKNGLHPGEEVDIAKWWLTSDCPDLSDGEMPTQAELLRTRISKLRARETQAQLVLALEVIAMEQRQHNTVGPSGPLGHRFEQEKQSPKLKKMKKAVAPTMLVEMMLDRLCIWQSVTTEENIQVPQGKVEESQSSTKDGAYTSSDDLKNFCIEVIVPFYSSRLPGLSSSICKKLGAPAPYSPARPPSNKPLGGTKSKTVRPGASIRRPPPPKRSRKTLERVLTDSQKPPLPRSRSQSTSAPPSLHRSTTEPTLPSLKREFSDQALVSIPLNRAPSLHVQKRYSQREVDLRSAAAATEAKLKRKAAVEQELKGAIAAMKKPNARMAVKELVEASERRKEGQEKGRKRKGEPVRNPFAQGLGVQVMATPMKNRSRHLLQRPGLPRMVATQPLPFFQVSEEEGELEEIPQSSAGRVPESTIRKSIRKGDVQHRDVEVTPTRGSSKFITPGLPSSSRRTLQRSFTTPSLVQPKSTPATQADRPSLPTVRRLPAPPNFATPTKPASTLKSTPLRRSISDNRALSSSFDLDTVGDTPQKQTTVRGGTDEAEPCKVVLDSSPPLPTQGVMEQEAEKDIYAALGWDNDDDELLM